MALIQQESGGRLYTLCSRREYSFHLVKRQIRPAFGYFYGYSSRYRNNEVFEFLKVDGKIKDIPIIAVSANAMPQDIERALEIGFKNYITKPIDVKELLSMIEEIEHLGL